MKKLLILFFLLLGSSQIQAGDYVIVRVVESMNSIGGVVAALHITDSEGTKRIALEAPKDKNISNNDGKILSEFMSLDKKGYRLVSSSGGDVFRSLIFYKE